MDEELNPKAKYLLKRQIVWRYFEAIRKLRYKLKFTAEKLGDAIYIPCLDYSEVKVSVTPSGRNVEHRAFCLDKLREQEKVLKRDYEQALWQAQRVLAHLPDRNRRVIFARYCKQKTIQEVCKEMQISPTLCKNITHDSVEVVYSFLPRNWKNYKLED